MNGQTASTTGGLVDSRMNTIDRRPRILLISFHSLMQKFDQRLPHEIVNQTGWNLKLLLPSFWRPPWNGFRKYPEKNFDRLFETIVIKSWFTGSRHLSLFGFQLKWLLKIFQPQLIHLLDEPYPLARLQISCLRNKFCSDCKIVYALTGDYPSNRVLKRILLKNPFLNNKDVLIVRNEQLRKALRNLAVPRFREFIPHGVNHDAFRPRELPELKRQLSGEGKPLIGVVNPDSNKELLMWVIKALTRVEGKVLEIGAAGQKAGLQNGAENPDDSIVRFPNPSQQEFAQFLNCMDVLVLPELPKNGLCDWYYRLLLQAMSSAVPVLVPEDENIREIIQDAGETYQSGAADLQKKIKGLLADPGLRSRLGWNGRKLVQSKYSLPKIARQTVHIYKHILNIA